MAWSLVIGTVTACAAYVAASHLLPVPYRNRFHWDKEAARELSQFGRWVMGSSAALYASVYAPQSDVTLSGNGAIYGSVVGKSVNMTGTSAIHYDLSLGGVSEEIVETAHHLLIGAGEEQRDEVRLTLELVQFQHLLDIFEIDEAVDAAVGIASHIDQCREIAGAFIQPMDRHDREKLIDRP